MRSVGSDPAGGGRSDPAIADPSDSDSNVFMEDLRATLSLGPVFEGSDDSESRAIQGLELAWKLDPPQQRQPMRLYGSTHPQCVKLRIPRIVLNRRACGCIMDCIPHRHCETGRTLASWSRPHYIGSEPVRYKVQLNGK